MIRNLPRLALAVLVTLFIGGEGWAHPHVWVTMKSELVYAADGSVKGVRHAWTFDEMFSTFATQGMDAKKPGGLTREELAPLAEVNVTSLKDFEYFTYAKANGKKTPLSDPIDYWLEHADGVLTLRFTLPFKTPVKTQSLDLEVYDPSYFVDFTLADKEPVTLVDAPALCKLAVAKPQDASAPLAGQKLGESFFENLTSDNYGAQFANKISVKCP
jgi:ABC-type uncharacterized transport system substrate-binding protein